MASAANPAVTVWQELLTWLAHITQSFGHNGETGVDIGLPYHTPVYALTSGPVLATGYYGGGGVVSIDSLLNGGGINGPASVYYQHLSDITVSPGQYVQAGQLIGYSGGQIGYGDHPSTTQYSDGPHIEVGINAPYGTATSGLWRPQGPNVNPVPFLQGVEQNAQAGIVGGAAPIVGDAFSATSADIANGISTGLQGAVSGVESGLLGAIGVKSLPDLLWRLGLIFFGVVIILLAGAALMRGEAQEGVTEILGGAGGSSSGGTAHAAGGARKLAEVAE